MIVFQSHWFFSIATSTTTTLISPCVHGIRAVSGVNLSKVLLLCVCPLILAQRLKPHQPAVTGRVISNSTWCPWNTFALFREHQIDFEFITEPSPQMAELLMGVHSRWWSLWKEYKEEFLFSLTLFFCLFYLKVFQLYDKLQVGAEGVICINFRPSEAGDFESSCEKWSETDICGFRMWSRWLLCILCDSWINIIILCGLRYSS